MTKYLYLFLFLTIAFAVTSCSDPRTAPVLAPDPAHTESHTLWVNAESNGQTISASFNVSAPLAAIGRPGVDTPARLTIAAFIEPDDDVLWYEKIVNDSLPAWDQTFIRLLVAIEVQNGVIDSVNGIRALCDTLPEECPADTSGLIAAEQNAMNIRSTYQDSVDAAVIDTTALGARRDSLGRVVDDRFTLAIWMDADTTTAYPEALSDEEGRLYGQEIYLSLTNSATGLKGRSFYLDMAQFEGADLRNPDRPIEFNWATCFVGSSRPCLSEGTHTIHARATGAVSKITAAVVLVYAEEQP